MKAQIISFHCVLKNKLGQVLSSSFNRDVINQMDEQSSGDSAQNLKGLIAGIQDVHEGERRVVAVSAHEAYGVYNPDLVLTLSRQSLSEVDDLVIGSEVIYRRDFEPSPRKYRVTQLDAHSVVLDANHPFAGQDLIFDIEVVSARDACQEDFGDAALESSHRIVH